MGRASPAVLGEIVRGWLTSRSVRFAIAGTVTVEVLESWYTPFVAAEGHGGNYIILLPELDMVIVTTADPLHDKWDENSWKYEGAFNRLVGQFVRSLPEE